MSDFLLAYIITVTVLLFLSVAIIANLKEEIKGLKQAIGFYANLTDKHRDVIAAESNKNYQMKERFKEITAIVADAEADFKELTEKRYAINQAYKDI
jgi:low affinity Fe/Cu permease